MKQAAVTLFDGLIITSDVRKAVEKWAKFIAIFLDCIDREKGHFLRFPWNVSRMEMPVKSMELLNYLQQIFIERINARYEKMNANIKGKVKMHG